MTNRTTGARKGTTKPPVDNPVTLLGEAASLLDLAFCFFAVDNGVMLDHDTMPDVLGQAIEKIHTARRALEAKGGAA